MENFSEAEKEMLSSINLEKYCSSTPKVPNIVIASKNELKRKKDSLSDSNGEHQNQNEPKKKSFVQHLVLDIPSSDLAVGTEDDSCTLIATPSLPPQILHNMTDPSPRPLQDAQLFLSSTNQASSSAISKWRGLRQRKTLPQPVRMMLAPQGIKYNERKSYYLYRHSQVDKTDTNILIFIHAENDGHVNCDNIGKEMNLRETATLSISSIAFKDNLQGPRNSYDNWFQEFSETNPTSILNVDDNKRVKSLKRAVEKLERVIDAFIFPTDHIFLFGMGSGATLVMETCLHRVRSKKSPLGGAVCVGGGIEYVPSNASTNQTRLSHFDSLIEKTATDVLVVTSEDDKKFSPMSATNAFHLYNECVYNILGNGPFNSFVDKSYVEMFIKSSGTCDLTVGTPEMQRIILFFEQRLHTELSSHSK